MTNSMQNPCPECGIGDLRETCIVYSGKMKYEGEVYSISVPDLCVLQCPHCKEFEFTRKSRLQITEALGTQLGILTPTRIRLLREAQGWTQQFLAEKMGIASETISRWESGSLLPSRAYSRYLCTVFNVPEVRHFLGLSQRPPSSSVWQSTETVPVDDVPSDDEPREYSALAA